MKRPLIAALTLCALTATAQKPAPLGITLQDHHTKRFYRLLPVSRATPVPEPSPEHAAKRLVPGPMATVDLQPTSNGRGAVSSVAYLTITGQRCRVFVDDGRLMDAQERHELLPRARHSVQLSELFLPDGHGGSVVIPMPPACPKLSNR